MKIPSIIILAFILLICLIILKYLFKMKEGAYMALVNQGNTISYDGTIGGRFRDLESIGNGDRAWCMQRCLDRVDCNAVSVDNDNACWLKNGIDRLNNNESRNTYVKVPDA